MFLNVYSLFLLFNNYYLILIKGTIETWQCLASGLYNASSSVFHLLLSHRRTGLLAASRHRVLYSIFRVLVSNCTLVNACTPLSVVSTLRPVRISAFQISTNHSLSFFVFILSYTRLFVWGTRSIKSNSSH